MNKVQLQNLVAIVDMAQKAGVINPDDMLPAAVSRKAAVDLLAQMTDETQTLIIDKQDNKPNAAKHEKGA